jgi:hypothetical protein
MHRLAGDLGRFDRNQRGDRLSVTGDRHDLALERAIDDSRTM